MKDKKTKHSKPMSKEDMELMQTLSDKSLTVALNSDSGEYYLYFKGDGNLTLNETVVMWGHLTDWITNRARELGEGPKPDQSLATHVIRHFGNKAVELGKEEALRIDSLGIEGLSEELVISVKGKKHE